jgi:hypothetical protein
VQQLARSHVEHAHGAVHAAACQTFAIGAVCHAEDKALLFEVVLALWATSHIVSIPFQILRSSHFVWPTLKSADVSAEKKTPVYASTMYCIHAHRREGQGCHFCCRLCGVGRPYLHHIGAATCASQACILDAAVRAADQWHLTRCMAAYQTHGWQREMHLLLRSEAGRQAAQRLFAMSPTAESR